MKNKKTLKQSMNDLNEATSNCEKSMLDVISVLNKTTKIINDGFKKIKVGKK